MTFALEARALKRFSDLSDDQLRSMAARTGYSVLGWDKYTRDQLLALLHNRFGRFVPEA